MWVSMTFEKLLVEKTHEQDDCDRPIPLHCDRDHYSGRNLNPCLRPCVSSAYHKYLTWAPRIPWHTVNWRCMLELPFITTCYQLLISGLAQAWDSPTCYFYIAYFVFCSYLVCHQSLASVRYIIVVETLWITLVSLFYAFVFNKFLCLFQKVQKEKKN